MAQSLTELTVSPASCVGGAKVKLGVRLDKPAPAGGATVMVTSSVVATFASVTLIVPAGKSTVSTYVTSSPVASNIKVSLKAAIGASSKTGSVTVLAPSVSTLKLAALSVEPGKTVTGTATLNAVAPAVGLSVRLSSDSAYASVPSKVVVPSGSRSATFTVTAKSPPSNTTVGITTGTTNGSTTAELTVLSFALSHSSPWAKFHGNAASTGLSASRTARGNVRWTLPRFMPVQSNLVIGPDGVLYYAAATPPVYETIYATNPDGSTRWTYYVAHEIQSSPALADDGTLYFGVADGSLLALNSSNGTKKWSLKLTYALYYSSPTIGPDGTIYIGSPDKNLYAVNPNGTKKWSFAAKGTAESAPALAPDGTIYFGTEDGWLHALTPAGKQKWTIDIGCNGISSPIVGPDGVVYIGSEDAYLFAINPDGSKKWLFQVGMQIIDTPGLGPDGSLYVVSVDNYLYAVSPNGKFRWMFLLGADYSSPAIAADGTIIVGSNPLFVTDPGRVWAFRPDGSIAWTVPLIYDNFCTSPAIGADGTVYISTSYGILYAIN